MADADPLAQWLQEFYGIPDDVWAAMMALNEAEQRVREADRQRMLAHIQDVVASMPDRLRAQGYDVPDGLRFEFVSEPYEGPQPGDATFTAPQAGWYSITRPLGRLHAPDADGHQQAGGSDD